MLRCLMATKEWIAPLVAAGITFAVMLFVQPPAATDDAQDYQVDLEERGFIYAFDAAPYVVRDGNDSAEVLLLSRDAQGIGDDGHGTTWRTPHVAVQHSSDHAFDCGGPWPCNPPHEVADFDTPRLFIDGYNATRVTAHVFDEAGRLIASNAPAEDRARFLDGAMAQDLPEGVWYLGAQSPAPNGTSPPPALAAAFVNALRPSLMGLPEGGVATTQSNAFVAIYGTLFATVRVDDLVHAP